MFSSCRHCTMNKRSFLMFLLTKLFLELIWNPVSNKFRGNGTAVLKGNSQILMAESKKHLHLRPHVLAYWYLRCYERAILSGVVLSRPGCVNRLRAGILLHTTTQEGLSQQNITSGFSEELILCIPQRRGKHVFVVRPQSRWSATARRTMYFCSPARSKAELVSSLQTSAVVTANQCLGESSNLGAWFVS